MVLDADVVGDRYVIYQIIKSENIMVMLDLYESRSSVAMIF